jgi:hypothetical protein
MPPTAPRRTRRTTPRAPRRAEPTRRGRPARPVGAGCRVSPGRRRGRRRRRVAVRQGAVPGDQPRGRCAGRGRPVARPRTPDRYGPAFRTSVAGETLRPRGHQGARPAGPTAWRSRKQRPAAGRSGSGPPQRPQRCAPGGAAPPPGGRHRSTERFMVSGPRSAGCVASRRADCLADVAGPSAGTGGHTGRATGTQDAGPGGTPGSVRQGRPGPRGPAGPWW